LFHTRGVRFSRGVATREAYVPPTMPTTAAASEGIKKAATEEKLTGMSDLRETDHGPGRFVLCIRGVDLKYGRVGTYAVFFDNNDYKGSRMSVMIDDCEKQDYRPSPRRPPQLAASFIFRRGGTGLFPFPNGLI